MARNDDRGTDKGRVKVRVIEFDMEGSNQTLRESIRDIVGAIGRGQVVRQLATPTIPSHTAALTQDSEDVLDTEQPSGVSSDSEGGVNGTGTKRQRFLRTPQVLDDLDLNSGSLSLKDFLEKLNPSSDMNRYVAIAYWIKAIRKIDEVTADHIHTGFKRMKWATPADASAPLRQMKGPAYGYFSKGGKPGSFKLNHVGDGHVESLMKSAGVEL
jgi:hypothetical protein